MNILISCHVGETVGTLTPQDKISFAKVLSTRIILQGSFFSFFLSLLFRDSLIMSTLPQLLKRMLDK